MSLKSRFPQEVLSLMYEYDATYREYMLAALHSDEMKYKLWDLWKKQLFTCAKLQKDHVFREKIEFILDHHFDEISREFPQNIEIYCGGKLFYYGDCSENPERAFEIFRERSFAFTRNEIEVAFWYSDGCKISIRGQVFTKEQYYSTFVFVDEDIYPELHCFHNNGDFYLLQYMGDLAPA